MKAENSVAQKPQTKDVYQIVTDTIIEYLQEGQIPWRKTWSSYGIARNYVSEHAYQGINFILMNILDYKYPLYLTYKQATGLGGSIMKGAKAHRVVYYAKVYKHRNGHFIQETEAKQISDKMYEMFLVPRYYRVFNVEFVKDVELKLPQAMTNTNEVITSCQAIIGRIKNPPNIDLHRKNSPAYSPKEDKISMPLIDQFNDSLEYYNTLYHELIHATGHENRLNRKGIIDHKPFGTVTYSKEELIAELGASFLCSKSGVNRASLMKNNAAYIQGWLEKLQDDKKLIFKAATEAKKAVKWILNE